MQQTNKEVVLAVYIIPIIFRLVFLNNGQTLFTCLPYTLFLQTFYDYHVRYTIYLFYVTDYQSLPGFGISLRTAIVKLGFYVKLWD